MNQKKKGAGNSMKIIQFAVIILLIGIPVTMIVLNGRSAVEAITWQKTKKTETPLASKTENHPIKFGIYDAHSNFTNDTNFTLEQIYISWADIRMKSLDSMLAAVYAKGRKPILTIEPWPLNAEDSISKIPTGTYDSVMNVLIKVLNAYKDTMYISWGHEMDQRMTKRYPWSGMKAESYVASYRYIVDYFNKKLHSKVHWVWAPIITDETLSYWPGENYVDIIGFPIYSFPDWDRSYHGYIRSFEKTFQEKYQKIQALKKPVFIIEFGVTGSGDFQQFWLSDAFNVFRKYKDLKGIIFFHSQDTPNAWGQDMTTPDWRSSPDLITALILWYNQSTN